MTTIRELRTEQGWTQLELSRRMDVTPSTIYNWERGMYDPKPRELRKLAEVFGLVSSDVIDLPTEGAAHRPRTQPKGGKE